MSDQESHDPHEEGELGKAYDARLMRRLLRYLRPYKGSAALAVFLLLLAPPLQLVGPLCVALILDLYLAPEQRAEELSPFIAWVQNVLPAGIDPAQGILLVSMILLASVVLAFLVVCVQGYVLQMMGQRIMQDLREEIFGHLQHLQIRYFDRNPIGRLVTRVTTDVAALNELFTSGIVSIVGDLVQLGGIVVVLFWLNWRLALVAFSIVPLLLLLSLWFKLRARQWLRRVRVKVARINAFLQEHVTGMSVVQLFGRESRVRRDFATINDEHREAHVQAIFYYAVYFPMVELITALGLGLLVWFGGGQVLRDVLSLGTLIAFLQYSQRFYQPLADLSERYNVLQGAMASSERIFELLDTKAQITSPAEPRRPVTLRGAIEFDDVTFGYLPNEPVLHGVSFRVEPGQTLAVVGHTGAGKSTLANLLLRFYDVDRGAVRLDGVDVRQWDLGELRRNVALVLQDVFLFSGSVGGNIRLGNEAIDEERLRWAAGEVGALPLIERLPQGFETPVRERGAGLSVGQKQLISFARAFAFDPRILILDEATSSIDTETEQLIQKALERLLEGRTSIVIAHRLSTIQKADRILVLHRGRICEEGTHQQLLARRGVYFKLYQLQYREQEVA